MFIDPRSTHDPRARGAQLLPVCLSGMREIPLRWSGQNGLEVVFYKHYVPKGRRIWFEEFCQKRRPYELDDREN